VICGKLSFVSKHHCIEIDEKPFINTMWANTANHL